MSYKVKKKIYISIISCTILILLISYYIANQQDEIIEATSIEKPNENQWGLLNVGQEIDGIKGLSGFDINILKAWEVTTGDINTLVGIVDSGIDTSNRFIQSQIFNNTNEIEGNKIDDDNNGYVDDTNGWDFYNNDNSLYDGISYDYHGTFLASIIVGQHTPNNEVWGIAPNVKIVPLKFVQSSKGNIDSAVEAINYGYNLGVRIFNLSWDSNVYNEDLFNLMNRLEDAIFITSAGKGRENVDEDPLYPCNFELENIVCVSAVDNKGDLEEFSGFGENLVRAPGVNIYGLLPNEEYSYSSGTSFATAYVTGIAALAKSANPNISSKILAGILINSNSEYNNGKDSVKVIDALKVINKALEE